MTALAKQETPTPPAWPSQTGRNPPTDSRQPKSDSRQNWLFAGSERAGKRAAAIQSLLGTARLNGLDPAAWLRDTLEKLPTWRNSRIDELLPLRDQVKT